MLAALIRLSRLKFLAGGLLGGALGTAVAFYEHAGIDWLAYALAQIAISALHLMTHFANDFYDQAGDALSVRTPFSGGSGVLQDGSLSPRVALRAAFVCAGAGLLAAAALAALGKPLAGATAIGLGALAWAYSAPPLRLLARGLGELGTAAVVAVLVPLCAYAAQTGRFDGRMLATTIPLAATMFAMMLAVEFPDIAADAASGKRNLVVRAGRRAVFRLTLLALAAVAGGLAIALATGAPMTFAAMFALVVPAAIGLLGALNSTSATARSAEIAARGVTLFFVTGLCSVLGYAVAAG